MLTNGNLLTLNLTNNKLAASTPQFTLSPKATSLNLTIFDLTGRRVFSSGARALDADRGNTVISWDGLTASGAPIKRGIYFVQCRFNDNSVQTQKLIIQK